MNDNEEETETREYEIRVVPKEGMIKTIVDIGFGMTGENNYRLFCEESNGELRRVRKDKAEELLRRQNTERYVVPIGDEESTEAKVLRHANFKVERGKTSRIQ